MKLGVSLTVALIAVSCCIQITSCVPIDTKEGVPDPCDLKELENIPKCKSDDKACDKGSVQLRKKRETLCEKNPNCSYCGLLIDDDVTDEALVDPDVIEPSYDDEELPVLTDEEEFRGPPKKLIERNIIIENDNETQYYRGYVDSAANITTVIRLTNLINNTNIVNMPTTLNNTNINNIHIYQNKSSGEGGKFGLGYTEQGQCCFQIQPKSCRQSTAGTKCKHKRQKVCGQQCTKKVIKNPCSYSPQWPYVNCAQNQYPQFNPGFYPNYPQPNYPPPSYPGFYPPQIPDEFDDDDDMPLFPDDEVLDNPESGWVVGPEKCKVVSEDGLQISNCTQKGVEFEHPFARNTVSESIKRSARHANSQPAPYQNQMPPQMGYYPVMYQPIYVQPMPVYMQPYYASPQMNYFQPQQIPYPPIDEAENYFEKSNEAPKTRKGHKKHHPIVMDIDEEL